MYRFILCSVVVNILLWILSFVSGFRVMFSMFVALFCMTMGLMCHLPVIWPVKLSDSFYPDRSSWTKNQLRNAHNLGFLISTDCSELVDKYYHKLSNISRLNAIFQDFGIGPIPYPTSVILFAISVAITLGLCYLGTKNSYCGLIFATIVSVCHTLAFFAPFTSQTLFFNFVPIHDAWVCSEKTLYLRNYDKIANGIIIYEVLHLGVIAFSVYALIQAYKRLKDEHCSKTDDGKELLVDKFLP